VIRDCFLSSQVGSSFINSPRGCHGRLDKFREGEMMRKNEIGYSDVKIFLSISTDVKIHAEIEI